MHPVLAKFPLALITFCAQHGGIAVMGAIAKSAYGHKPATRIDYTHPLNMIVTCALLATLCTCPWTRLVFLKTARKPPRCVRFFIDVWLTAIVAGILMSWLWLPALEVSYSLCQQTALLLANWMRGHGAWVQAWTKPVVLWLRRDATTVIRFLMVLLFVWVALLVTGMVAQAGELYVRHFGREAGDPGASEDGMDLSEACAGGGVGRPYEQDGDDVVVVENRQSEEGDREASGGSTTGSTSAPQRQRMDYDRFNGLAASYLAHMNQQQQQQEQQQRSSSTQRSRRSPSRRGRSRSAARRAAMHQQEQQYH